MSNIFNQVGALRPKRNVFDLSYRKNFTCDFGQLVPVVCEEVVPGDYIKIGNQTVVRMQPLAAPIMHELDVSVHYFFVANRLVWEDWEHFISQGTRNDDGSLPIPLPKLQWSPDKDNQLGQSLWDYFGLPMLNLTSSTTPSTPGIQPMDLPWRAYNFVWNEYYRDENLQDKVQDLCSDDVPLTNTGAVPDLNRFVLHRNWKKDYFTASLPFRQAGTPPALPVNVNLSYPGSLPVGYISNNSSLFRSLSAMSYDVGAFGLNNTLLSGPDNGAPNPNGNAQPTVLVRSDGSANPSGSPSPSLITEVSGFNATASTFDVSDLRLAFQTQKWLERNARGGHLRYTEFLQSHFGVSPSDSRLQRPEYIGGTKMPIIINEVLQTSQTTDDSQLAQMGGHGLASDGQYAGDYNVQEYGWIIGLLSIMPKPAYQDGINRQFLRELPTDFYFPEFAHLSEQAVMQAEIQWSFGYMVTDPITGAQIRDTDPFGFIGQYDEMRIKHDMICSDMRWLKDPSDNPTNDQYNLSYWNMARKFGLTNPPKLGSEFITCSPDKRIFLEQTRPGFIVNVQNLIKAVRPMPSIAEPGLIDHF